MKKLKFIFPLLFILMTSALCTKKEEAVQSTSNSPQASELVETETESIETESQDNEVDQDDSIEVEDETSDTGDEDYTEPAEED